MDNTDPSTPSPPQQQQHHQRNKPSRPSLIRSHSARPDISPPMSRKDVPQHRSQQSSSHSPTEGPARHRFGFHSRTTPVPGTSGPTDASAASTRPSTPTAGAAVHTAHKRLQHLNPLHLSHHARDRRDEKEREKEANRSSWASLETSPPLVNVPTNPPSENRKRAPTNTIHLPHLDLFHRHTHSQTTTTTTSSAFSQPTPLSATLLGTGPSSNASSERGRSSAEHPRAHLSHYIHLPHQPTPIAEIQRLASKAATATAGSSGNSKSASTSRKGSLVNIGGAPTRDIDPMVAEALAITPYAQPPAAVKAFPLPKPVTREDVRRERELQRLRDREVCETADELALLARDTGRRFDSFYASLFERLDELRGGIRALQALSDETAKLRREAGDKARGLFDGTEGQIGGFEKGLEGQEGRIGELDDRVKRGMERAKNLNDRLEAARKEVEVWELREKEWQRRTTKRLNYMGMCALVGLAILLLVVSVKVGVKASRGELMSLHDEGTRLVKKEAFRNKTLGEVVEREFEMWTAGFTEGRGKCRIDGHAGRGNAQGNQDVGLDPRLRVFDEL